MLSLNIGCYLTRFTIFMDRDLMTEQNQVDLKVIKVGSTIVYIMIRVAKWAII